MDAETPIGDESLEADVMKFFDYQDQLTGMYEKIVFEDAQELTDPCTTLMREAMEFWCASCQKYGALWVKSLVLHEVRENEKRGDKVIQDFINSRRKGN